MNWEPTEEELARMAANERFREENMPPLDESISIHEVLMYWKERGTMIAIVDEGDGWRVCADVEDGQYDGGISEDPTEGVRRAHRVLLFWQIQQSQKP